VSQRTLKDELIVCLLLLDKQEEGEIALKGETLSFKDLLVEKEFHLLLFYN